MNDYSKYVSKDTLMGPSSLRILEELLNRFPLRLSAEDTVLDLGCGKGLTSLMAACETGTKVVAADLWINAEDNAARFADWGIADKLTPVNADANCLPFENGQFDAMISVDSYHYYGGSDGFFEEKIMPFMKKGAEILIGIPGIKNEFSGRSDELLSPWLGEDAHMFKSASDWKEILSGNESLSVLETCELDCFTAAWDEWFASGHKFAEGDKQFFDDLIKPYTCFVGIYIKLK